MDKLPIALWAYHTTLKQPISETPYTHAFGVEALIPIESRLEITSTDDTFELSHTLDELEEKRVKGKREIEHP